MNWPLRGKMIALLVIASVLPLAISAVFDVLDARDRLKASSDALLAARGDQLAGQIDTFNRSYQRSADKISHLPDVIEFCRSAPEAAGKNREDVRTLLDLWPAGNANFRGLGILDLYGVVRIATEDAMVGVDLSGQHYVREALKGGAVMSDLHLAGPEVGSVPTIAYATAIIGPDQKTIGVAVSWIKAEALWKIIRAADELAGRHSFAVMFDHRGVRIAHTASNELLFHPGEQLDLSAIKEMVAERRFGEQTQRLLEDARPFPEQFARARSETIDPGVFRGFAPSGSQWCYGVARRLTTAPWTVFYMIPESSLNAEIAQMTKRKVMFAGVIILIALAAGALFAAVILKPVGALAKATEAISGGDLSARVPGGSSDELGQLGERFNLMASRIEAQAAALQKAHDELEQHVQERTAKLAQTAKSLEGEIVERERAEDKIQAQLGRLTLLHQITRATGERQDLKSILQVAIRSLEENMPLDFGCACLYDPAADMVTVTSVGLHSEALAAELAMTEQANIPVDRNGLSRCVQGHLVYEPDLAQVPFPFPQQLLRGGLRSLVMAPLLVESKVFGVLVAARREMYSFSSGECEFLRQLSEHVALAAHQAQIYAALQIAYDDLRQTQEAVMQQERLRSLGQMASGIAHDINNAISPVVLYTESILSRETNLSARSRENLETIQRAIEDVAATVERMGEFYRQREPQLALMPVSLNEMAQHVVDFTKARWSDIPLQRGIDLKVEMHLDPELPSILGVESEIREALTNLMFNAIDAMPEGGTIILRTSHSQRVPDSPERTAVSLVHFEISDTGQGMDEETRRRCLEPFFTTKGKRGTGLGLAMVYGIVQRHSAELDVESAVGKGTTFRLTFPVPQINQNAPTTTVVTTNVVPSRLRLLVVDDDPMLLKSLRDTLENDGHVIETAHGGQAGIDAFHAAKERGEPYDAIFTDLGMPEVDGRKVAAFVKMDSPFTPVIMLTGWGQRLIAEGEVPPHVDRVLGKPPKIRELRAALAACCGVAQASMASKSLATAARE